MFAIVACQMTGGSRGEHKFARAAQESKGACCARVNRMHAKGVMFDAHSSNKGSRRRRAVVQNMKGVVKRSNDT